MSTLNKKVALAICRAQCASNGGKKHKSDWSLNGHTKKEVADFRGGYSVKDTQIRFAISQILCQHGKSGFDFSVVRHTEDVGYYSVEIQYIVYFGFYVDGERKQVSFHSYDRGLEKYVAKCDISGQVSDYIHVTRWDQKSSMETVRVLEDSVLRGKYRTISIDRWECE